MDRERHPVPGRKHLVEARVRRPRSWENTELGSAGLHARVGRNRERAIGKRLASRYKSKREIGAYRPGNFATVFTEAFLTEPKARDSSIHGLSGPVHFEPENSRSRKLLNSTRVSTHHDHRVRVGGTPATGGSRSVGTEEGASRVPRRVSSRKAPSERGFLSRIRREGATDGNDGEHANSECCSGGQEKAGPA